MSELLNPPILDKTGQAIANKLLEIKKNIKPDNRTVINNSGMFIDVNNVIKEATNFTTSMTYTATEDCYIRLYVVNPSNASVVAKIDNVSVWTTYGTSTLTTDGEGFFVKKGQIFSVTGANSSYDSSYAVYGVQKGSNFIDKSPFMDIHNVVQAYQSISSQTTYVASQDCVVQLCYSGTGSAASQATLNGVVVSNFGGSNATLYTTIYMRAGDTLVMKPAGSYNGYAVYGLIDSDYDESRDVIIPMNHIYSNEEQQIGIWTDGKPLYEKTVHISALPSSTYTETSYPHGIANIDVVCNWEGCIRWSSGSTSGLPEIQFTSSSFNNTASVTAFVGKTNIDITTGYNRSDMNGDFTIRYTKTTDTAGACTGSYKAYGFSPVIYSEQEREIGVWTDGKPLYQKTYILSSVITLPQNTWTIVISDVSSLSIDRLVFSCGNPTSSQTMALNSYLDGSAIKVFSTFNWSISAITIQYTKITDVTGSGKYTTLAAPSAHYSTSEHVIGTWIDGKTVYEKTIYDTGQKSGNFSINHGITNLEKILSYEGIVSDTSGMPYPLPRIASDKNNVGVQSCDTTVVNICNPSAFGTRLRDFYITLRYTKTT